MERAGAALAEAEIRLAEERRSRCAPPGTVEFWQYEVDRLRREFEEAGK